jgi:hypothetical protein
MYGCTLGPIHKPMSPAVAVMLPRHPSAKPQLQFDSTGEGEREKVRPVEAFGCSSRGSASDKSGYLSKLKLKLARGSQQEDLDRPCANQWQEHATVLLYYCTTVLQTSRVRGSPGVVECAMRRRTERPQEHTPSRRSGVANVEGKGNVAPAFKCAAILSDVATWWHSADGTCDCR